MSALRSFHCSKVDPPPCCCIVSLDLHLVYCLILISRHHFVALLAQRSVPCFWFGIIGLFQKKIVSPPPVEDLDLFETDPPGFPVKFTVTPGTFHFSIFYPPPLEIHVFSSIFGVPTWNSNEFYSTPGIFH